MLSFVLMISTAFAMPGDLGGPWTLDWDDNSETDIACYRVYWSAVPGKYNPTDMIGNIIESQLFMPDSGIPEMSYVIVTAVDVSGNESEASDELLFDKDNIGPGNPGGCGFIQIPKNSQE